MEEVEIQLVNELVDIQRNLEKLWEFHPDNPNRTDVLLEYNYWIERFKQIESKIDGIRK